LANPYANFGYVVWVYRGSRTNVCHVMCSGVCIGCIVSKFWGRSLLNLNFSFRILRLFSKQQVVVSQKSVLQTAMCLEIVT